MVRLHGKPECLTHDLFNTTRWHRATALLHAFNQQNIPSESDDLFE
jgi:hypothetical protein